MNGCTKCCSKVCSNNKRRHEMKATDESRTEERREKKYNMKYNIPPPNHEYIKWRKRRSNDQTYVHIKERLLDRSRPYLFRMFQIFDQSGGACNLSLFFFFRLFFFFYNFLKNTKTHHALRMIDVWLSSR